MTKAFRALWTKDLRHAAAVQLHPTSNQLYFVYTGRTERLNIDPMVFFSQTGLSDRNVVMFRDRQGNYYTHGIAPSLPSFETFLAWKSNVCRSLPHVRRVFCLGTSMGAYAAILYGYHLNAEQVFAFGPPLTAKELGVAGYQRSAFPDLSELLLTSNGVTTYHIYFNASFARDHANALRLSTADGVILHPQGGEGHTVVTTLFEAGALPRLLPEPS